ncbi:class I SAM-dependent methyltransferase [Acidovorax sp.]|uniref:class I SAM-dependent methyltransferase n=1 Tax=Acidovorax sp. TaxID=1872122 RepID=UPI0025C0BEC7|nr:class I SAM-dependent methyltransferase [Acidovorax sp.]MBL7091679.1 class I SAM-dependent methyltransferase [Acidovorax sp.]
MKIVDLISTQNPLQRRRINAFISQQDTDYWTFAEQLCRTLNHSFFQGDQERVEAARAYNRMCMDFVREQIRFRKTGVYRLDDAYVAHEEVYSQPDVMRYYMVGLLLSYLFWPNHYAMLCFLRDHLQQISINRYLEIAPGHGLFTVQAIKHSPDLEATLVDISEVSIEVVRELLTAFQIDPARIRFIHSDFLDLSLESDSFDFISMGEVIEHVNDAPGFMKQAHRLLQPSGAIFLTTCANCPSIDHVYHFHTVDEIRTLIRDAGLSIVRDVALPAEDVPVDRWQEELVTINYFAILTKE